jgi:hypothetical protein
VKQFNNSNSQQNLKDNGLKDKILKEKHGEKDVNSQRYNNWSAIDENNAVGLSNGSNNNLDSNRNNSHPITKNIT